MRRRRGFLLEVQHHAESLYGLTESAALYQSCVMLASAVIVDLSAVKVCWEALRLRSFRFSLSWILSSTLATCGKTEICLKSLFISMDFMGLGGTSAIFLFFVLRPLSRGVLSLLAQAGFFILILFRLYFFNIHNHQRITGGW